MVQRNGSPYCPVASFEIYMKNLDPACESLFVQPARVNSDLGADLCYRPGFSREFLRYSTDPLSSVQLAGMMENIAQAAKLPYHFSCLSAAEVQLQH